MANLMNAIQLIKRYDGTRADAGLFCAISKTSYLHIPLNPLGQGWAQGGCGMQEYSYTHAKPLH